MENKDEIIHINPEVLTPIMNSIENDYNLKHWYELGIKIYDLLLMDEIKGYRLFIYDKLISYFALTLETFQYAKILVLISQEATDNVNGMEFLKSKLNEFKDNILAQDFIKLRIVFFYTQLGDFEKALAGLTEIETRITDNTMLTVRAQFYLTQAELDKARADYDSFYYHSLLYLSTSGVTENSVLAFDLCMAALFSSKVCSFGELAAHPILNSLQGNDQWLANLIRLLDCGESSTIQEFNQKYVPIIKNSPLFADHLQTIQQKLSLSVFLQMIFIRPFKSRTFTFDEIASCCQILKNEVEYLVMKALATDIIKGEIDEVKEIVVITWCKPKTLDKTRLMHLKGQIDQWKHLVHQQRLVLEKRSQPVVG